MDKGVISSDKLAPLSQKKELMGSCNVICAAN